MTVQPTTPPALDGLRAVLLSPTRTGLQAGQLLADFGADVVHVERPGGSPLRADAAWPFWARGSRSVELDLRDPDDLSVARGLIDGSDVVIDTFRPGVAERLGLGYDDLRATNPRLVYASITGFGRIGPYADLQGYEAVIMAKTGVLWQWSGLVGGSRPAFPAALYASFPASQLALQGIFTALYDREATGLGQRIESTIAQALTVHDTLAWFSRVVATRYENAFVQAPIAVDGVPSGGLSFRLLVALTADGYWMQFSQTTDRLFRAMMDLLELGWMFDDPEWAGLPNFDDIPKRVAFWEKLLLAVNAKPLAEWQRLFDVEPNVWAETFRRGNEVLDHPQTIHNEMRCEIDDPEVGTVLQPAALLRLHGNPARLDRPAPRRGEHDSAIRELAATPAPATPATGAMANIAAPTERGGAPDTPPLAGLTVIELGTYYAAPFGATLLAEYGARVIKIEEPAGDPMRNMMPFPDVAGIKALLGKESIAVDIGTAAGREVVLDLVRRADVVLQSFRAGVAERLGLGPDDLRAVNPDLVYVAAPGYGTSGPCGHRPAFAPTIGAAAGLVDRNAHDLLTAGEPMDLPEIKRRSLRVAQGVMGVGNCDGYAGVTVATAMALGLLVRQRTGQGQSALTTMLSTSSHALSEDMVRYAGRGPAPTTDPEHYGLSPLYRLYEASDGWIFLAAPNEPDWARLTGALPDGSQLAADPRFARPDDRQANADALAGALATVFRADAAADWERRLREAGVAGVEVVRGPVEAHFLDDASLGDVSGFVTSCRHSVLDEIPRLAPLVRFSRSGTVAGDPCAIGEHTLPIVEELGYDRQRIDELLAAKVIAV